jgi:methylmalonyl-CoA mutase N-terminal domain/subunit
VGVNDFVQDNDAGVKILYIDDAASDTQLARLESLRAGRDNAEVRRTLDRLREAATGIGNLMPPILDAVRAYATLGEMCDALRDVWGEYEEVAVI